MLPTIHFVQVFDPRFLTFYAHVFAMSFIHGCGVTIMWQLI